MKNIAIIPARGGSKRIPRKNIKNFFGKPILAYSINIALESGLFDEVMVSTDDEEIAKIAIEYSAKVPFLRSEENANDYATTSSVITEVLSEYAKQDESQNYSYGCCIYSAAPLISVNRLKEGYQKLLAERRETVFPVLQFSYPIWRSLELDLSGNVNMIWPEFLNTRSQDLKSAFHDAGQWYWFDCDSFSRNNLLLSNNSASIVLKDFEAQDIDNDEDWFLAEKKYEFININPKKNDKI